MCHFKNLEAIYSAIAILEVRPGDSIPKRLTRPGTPWISSPCMKNKKLTIHHPICTLPSNTNKKIKMPVKYETKKAVTKKI